MTPEPCCNPLCGGHAADGVWGSLCESCQANWDALVAAEDAAENKALDVA